MGFRPNAAKAPPKAPSWAVPCCAAVLADVAWEFPCAPAGSKLGAAVVLFKGPCGPALGATCIIEGSCATNCCEPRTCELPVVWPCWAAVWEDCCAGLPEPCAAPPASWDATSSASSCRKVASSRPDACTCDAWPSVWTVLCPPVCGTDVCGTEPSRTPCSDVPAGSCPCVPEVERAGSSACGGTGAWVLLEAAEAPSGSTQVPSPLSVTWLPACMGRGALLSSNCASSPRSTG